MNTTSVLTLCITEKWTHIWLQTLIVIVHCTHVILLNTHLILIFQLLLQTLHLFTSLFVVIDAIIAVVISGVDTIIHLNIIDKR